MLFIQNAMLGAKELRKLKIAKLTYEIQSSPPLKKRRRIIMEESDSDEENVPPESFGRILSPSILQKIGAIKEITNQFNLSPEIIKIWQEILNKGLDKAKKEDMIKNISLIKDCCTNAPLLNQEIRATLSSAALKRDQHLCAKQTQIGVAVAGLSNILQTFLEKSTCIEDKVIEDMSTCIRLLLDVHHMESQTRRAVILPGLNKNMKECLEKTEINEYLFGKDLNNIIREAKTLGKSKKDLSKENPLNNWSPSRGKKQGGPSNYRNTNRTQPKFSTLNRQRHHQHRQHFRSMVRTEPKERRQVPVEKRHRQT
ncbi:hypothetical protein ACJJTC_013193 [Scirpophaga incertulas]